MQGKAREGVVGVGRLCRECGVGRRTWEGFGGAQGGGMLLSIPIQAPSQQREGEERDGLGKKTGLITNTVSLGSCMIFKMLNFLCYTQEMWKTGAAGDGSMVLV